MINGVPGITSTMVVLFAVSIIVVFLLLFGAFWMGWWVTQRERGLSPYSGLPLRRATDLSYFSIERVLRFLHALNQYENRIFEFKKAGLCRETGRLFPNCVTWFDTIKIDWKFIQKRFPGDYVSWGSLNDLQIKALREVHESLDGFQTEISSPAPSPRMVDAYYAFTKPGPLYVDVNTGTLVGWKSVSETELEVLIVQRPTKMIVINVPQE